jgi:putative FmdB family regulatory protein
VPTYSYACTDCDDRFDTVQAFTDDSLTTCAKCSGRLRKLFHSVGVVFKGTGFYRTDSRESAKSPSPASADSSGSGSAEKSGSSAKSEKSSASADKAGVKAGGSTPAPAAAAAAS